jgi:hypothetical protein
MLPSLLAKDIRTSLKRFLVSGFEPADPFMHGLMSRFVEDESGWLKGPYVQVGLPFVPGQAQRGFFSGFKTEFPGYSHQERAWERLASDRLAANTLVATGTGSGKTECFLYPVLDHCARARAAGETGIKALVIYPMNALATDQARRIAHLVATVPAFAGLRVGLYVGGQSGAPGQGLVMDPDQRHHGSGDAAQASAGHPADQLQDAGLPDAAAQGPPALVRQYADHPAVCGGRRAPYLRRRPGDRLGALAAASAGPLAGAGGAPDLRRDLRDPGRPFR